MSGRAKQAGAVIGSGAPDGNGNATKHGVHSYLATGELPEDVRERVDEFATDLDAAIAERHGDGQLPFAVRCRRETAISNYAVAMLRARWTGQELAVETKDKLVQGALNCLDKRDTKVADMDLDASPEMLDVAAVLSEIHREQAAHNRTGRDGDGIDQSGSDASETTPSDHTSNEGQNNGD